MITSNEQLREFVASQPTSVGIEGVGNFKLAMEALTYALGEMERKDKIIFELNNDVWFAKCQELEQELTRIKNIGVEEIEEIIINYTELPNAPSYGSEGAAQAVLDFINGKEVINDQQ